MSDIACMTLPRQVVPGRDYMITRRCSERRFFLRPDDDTNDAFYCFYFQAMKHQRLDLLEDEHTAAEKTYF